MSDVVKDDGTVAELTERSVIIAQGGDPDRDVAMDGAGSGGGKEAAIDPGTKLEVADTTEAVHDADAGVGDGGGKDAAKWYGDSDVELARSYGLDEGALGEFESAGEFRKAAMFFDRRLKVELAAPKDEEKPAAPPAEEVKPGDNDFDVSVFTEENGYDQDTIRLVKAMAAQAAEVKSLKETISESRARAAEDAQRQAAERYQEFVSEFHQSVDALGDELFGNATKDDRVRLGAADSEAAQRRFKLFQAIHDYGDRFGNVSLATKIQRARDIEFGDVMREREKKQMLEGIASQSKKRRPVASSNRQQRTIPASRKPPENTNDIDYILDDPDFQGRWKKVEER